MKSTKVTAKWLAIALLLAVTALVAHWIDQNSNLRGRISLLANGHVVCRVSSPERFEGEIRTHENEIWIAKNVYQRGALIGFLDRYGHFVPMAQNGFDLSKEGNITIILYAAQVVFFALSLFALIMFATRLKSPLSSKPMNP